MNINNKTKNQDNVNANQIANIQSMEKRVEKLTTRLWAGLFLLFIMLSAGILLFANFYYEQLALALTGNYTMTSGDLLTAGDWNNLSTDFVDRSGDVMSGNLTAPNVCSTAGDCLDNLVSKSGDAMSGSLSVGGGLSVGGNASANNLVITGNFTANSNSPGSCAWTGAVETGCAETSAQLSCPNGRFMAGVRNYGQHNCSCLGGDYECSYLKLYCCEL